MADDKKKIIVDLDIGTDDYLALLILLHYEKIGQVSIEAIVCTRGNTTVENVTKNVIRLLEAVERTDIPVYRGAEHPLLLHNTTLIKFHGEDGLGDLEYDTEPDISVVRDIPGATAINEIITNNPGLISILCIGPLTNLALSIKLYSDVKHKVKDVWVMGGNHTAVGNCTSSAEYNFYCDPEAAFIVLECLKCPIFLLPWESCLKPNISFDWRYNVLRNHKPVLHLLTRAEKKIWAATSYSAWYPCDAFLSFCFVNPEHITQSRVHHATVELHSSHTRGQVVLDHLKQKKPNITIIEEFDEDLFKKVLLDVEADL